MATYNQLSYGSKGSDVTELQKLLNQNGYTLDVDGDFGEKTQAAVKDYQQKNNLSVDGIVGTNTWGALNGTYKPTNNTGNTATNTTATNTTTANTATDTGFKYDAYQESDIVKQAQALLQQQMANKPGAYTSQWQTQLADIIQQIQNREEFSYDLNNDALYQQYANQYILQGQKAMMDTMGQAQTMTGGYGNSYAQSVGQQAYQGYVQQLNDKVPELYQLALSKYQMEGDEMKDQAALIAQMEDRDYGRYQDQLNQYYTELEQAYDRYDTERDYDYGKWADGRDFGYGQYIDDRNYQYQQDRDKVSDEQWQKEYEEAIRQFNYAHGLGEFAPVAESVSTDSPSSPGRPGTVYDTHGYTKEEIMEMQKAAGIAVDGVWGSQTQNAYNSGYRPDSGGGGDYYEQLLGAVSTAKGAASNQNSATKQEVYKESTAAINDAYKNGQITADEKKTLLSIATPGAR